MTDFVQNLGRILCVSAVLAAVLSILTPGKKLGKAVQMLTGILMILIVAGQVTELDMDELSDSLHFSNPDVPTQTESTQAYWNLLQSEVESQIAQNIEENLGQQGVSIQHAEISVHIDDSGHIYCDKVLLYLNDDSSKDEDRVRQQILDQLGQEPEIYYE